MLTLAQKYLETRVSDISKADVLELIKEKLEELILDFGQKIEEESLYYLVNRTNELITSKYRYWTWGDIDQALERGKIGQYSKSTINSSKVTVQKIQSWFFNYSEERSRQRIHEKKSTTPNPVDKSAQAPPEYGHALSYKLHHLSRYPDLYTEYPLTRIIKHIQEGTLRQLTEQINLQKEHHEPIQTILSGRSEKNKKVQKASSPGPY